MRGSDLADDLQGQLLAGRAAGVVDAALSDGELAAAGAGLGIHALQGEALLFSREPFEIHAREIGGVRCVLQEDLSFVDESFDRNIDVLADRLSETLRVALDNP